MIIGSSAIIANPLAIYLLGMSFFVVLAVVFCLSIRYYIKAKNLVPYMRKLKELVERISELQQKVEVTEKWLKEKLAEVTHAEKLIQQGKDAENWLKEHKGEIEDTQKVLEKVRTEFESEKVQKTDLDRQISERQQQLVEMANKAVEAETKRKDAEKAVEDIRKENAELTTQVPALRAERDELQRDIQEKKTRVIKLTDMLQEQTDRLNVAKGEIEKLQGMVEAKKAELGSLQERFEKAQKQVNEKEREIAELETRARIAEQVLAQLEKHIPALRAEHDELKNDIQAEKDRLANLSRKEQERTDRLNAAKGEIEKLQGMIDAKKAELESLQKSLEKVQKQMSEKSREISNLEARAGIAEQTLTRLAAQREESGEKWKNLDAPIVDEQLMRDVGTDLDENLWLEDFGDRLRDNGFIFDERAIRAFHTGLKCAMQTPLVVLSGISGTGKSLLPELYASALGMNFLSVPVQPRWDSPQDLFGFYNYMEGRYKATELSRLLWQFDYYNNPSASEKYTGENLPMNLVLLDEMNLARVEYYFSDLLSKLETRNGLDAEDELERKKAEIELECNAADKMDSMRRLFVSPYTLFVGTMNEDESTQTLSDKVIDRANVLRFGRPKLLGDSNAQIVQEPNKSGFISTYAGDNRVSAEIWDGWCQKLDEAAQDSDGLMFLRKTVTPVVDALDKVYRSYGFRVDKAMKLYVMNYPGNYKEAVADQIEMKILPKLNGVELQDAHFDEVKMAVLSAIDATEDDKLRAAFLEACPEGGTFFKWRGVMR